MPLSFMVRSKKFTSYRQKNFDEDDSEASATSGKSLKKEVSRYE